MFWFLLYFMVSYGAVALGLTVLRALKVSRRWKIVFSAILLMLPLVPYARVAIQTALYKKELLPAFHAGTIHTGGGEILTFRVLKVSPWRAEVYVVNPCEGGMGSNAKSDKVGWVMGLTKTSQGWKFADYDAVWSDCGSAEGNTFPPYPEAHSF